MLFIFGEDEEKFLNNCCFFADFGVNGSPPFLVILMCGTVGLLKLEVVVLLIELLGMMVLFVVGGDTITGASKVRFVVGLLTTPETDDVFFRFPEKVAG